MFLFFLINAKFDSITNAEMTSSFKMKLSDESLTRLPMSFDELKRLKTSRLLNTSLVTFSNTSDTWCLLINLVRSNAKWSSFLFHALQKKRIDKKSTDHSCESMLFYSSECKNKQQNLVEWKVNYLCYCMLPPSPFLMIASIVAWERCLIKKRDPVYEKIFSSKRTKSVKRVSSSEVNDCRRGATISAPYGESWDVPSK